VEVQEVGMLNNKYNFVVVFLVYYCKTLVPILLKIALSKEPFCDKNTVTIVSITSSHSKINSLYFLFNLMSFPFLEDLTTHNLQAAFIKINNVAARNGGRELL
jgi:hypothetical protein